MTNTKALAAWEQAKAATNVEKLPPQVQYALRRIGGPGMLGACDLEFIQAFNESPVVDADLDTEKFPGEILVRPLERKDGVS